MDRIRNETIVNKSVFPNRPWMMSLGAAAASGEGNKGLKGIVAGDFSSYFKFLVNVKSRPINIHSL